MPDCVVDVGQVAAVVERAADNLTQEMRR